MSGTVSDPHWKTICQQSTLCISKLFIRNGEIPLFEDVAHDDEDGNAVSELRDVKSFCKLEVSIVYSSLLLLIKAVLKEKF